MMASASFGQDCGIKCETDKFTGDKRCYYLGVLMGTSIGLSKTISAFDTAYYISVNVPAVTVTFGKGVFILLDDGQKISRPGQKVEVDVASGGGFVAKSFFKITMEELKLLQEHKATDVKAYIYTGSIRKSGKLKEAAQCIESL